MTGNSAGRPGATSSGKVGAQDVPDEARGPSFFDPISTLQLTHSICWRFEREPVTPLADIGSFHGAGLYAIYYEGRKLALYRPLRGTRIPLYVGQAFSDNTSTGRPSSARSPLAKRVREHRASIVGAELPVRDFAVGLLLMPDVHIALGENGLLTGYQPVWNSVLTGFGSHEQGPSTRSSSRSKWDTVHPGRKRTFGAQSHDAAALKRQVRRVVADQVERAQRLPWREPARGVT